MATNDDYMMHEDGIFRVERFTNVMAVERKYPTGVRNAKGIEVARYRDHIKVMIPMAGPECSKVIALEQERRNTRAFSERGLYNVTDTGGGTYRVNRAEDDDNRSYEVSSHDWSCTCIDSMNHRQILCKHAVFALMHERGL